MKPAAQRAGSRAERRRSDDRQATELPEATPQHSREMLLSLGLT